MAKLFPPQAHNAGILLADGTFFPGYSFGFENEKLQQGILGECVFNTSMSGYQEVFTDPSYFGQFVVMTYPHIGNTGINPIDWESQKLFLSGVIVREPTEFPSNWRSTSSLAEVLKAKGIPAIGGVDTRALTRHIRDKGSMNAYFLGMIPESKAAQNQLLVKLQKEAPFGAFDMVAAVSCKEPYSWTDAGDSLSQAWNVPLVHASDAPLVAVLDLGVKHNMLRALVQRGCRVKIFPSTTSAADILAVKPKGLLLSNGPGDPDKVARAPDTVRQLLGKVPIFGICMGHQILAQAIGAKTFKMKFGHRGANQPVLDIETGKVLITSQNHGYSVDAASLPKGVVASQINLNDQSIEGLSLPEQQAFTVQYHPEACPGPRDSMFLFDRFLRSMGYE